MAFPERMQRGNEKTDCYPGNKRAWVLDCFSRFCSLRAIALNNRNLVGHSLFRGRPIGGQHHPSLGDGIPSSRKWDKAFAHNEEDARALKEFGLARSLDSQDPTPWLYSALLLQQENRINEAIDHLENSIERNDNRSLMPHYPPTVEARIADVRED